MDNNIKEYIRTDEKENELFEADVEINSDVSVNNIKEQVYFEKENAEAQINQDDKHSEVLRSENQVDSSLNSVNEQTPLTQLNACD